VQIKAVSAHGPSLRLQGVSGARMERNDRSEPICYLQRKLRPWNGARIATAAGSTSTAAVTGSGLALAPRQMLARIHRVRQASAADLFSLSARNKRSTPTF